MSGPCMTIDGRVTGASATFGVIDPATGAVFAAAPDCAREQLDQALEAAVRAGRAWRADESPRVAALHAMADAIDANSGELAALLTAEQGKPLSPAGYEVSETSRWLRAAAALELPVETLVDDGKAHAELRRRPIGVVAAPTSSLSPPFRIPSFSTVSLHRAE